MAVIMTSYGSCDECQSLSDATTTTSSNTPIGGDQSLNEEGKFRRTMRRKPHATGTMIITIIAVMAALLALPSTRPLGNGGLPFSNIEQASLVVLGKSSHKETTSPRSIIVPNPHAYPRRPFILHDGCNVTLPVLGFPGVALAPLSHLPDDQWVANAAVRHAVEDLDMSYFDVAPEYGDGVAQARLGPALKPYREHVFLAAKTMYRTAEGAVNDLNNTLHALQTNHLDLYQFHSISTQRDVDTILGPGGAMETFQLAKKQGKIKAIGFSAHSEPMALQMIQSGLVDTCMFPINFVSWHYGGVGPQVLQAAIQHKVGVIALKAGARGRLTSETGNVAHIPDTPFQHIPEWKRHEELDFGVRTSKAHPTEWYEPEDDPIALNNLILWSLHQPGVTAVLPPGSLELLDGISELLRGKSEVPPFDERNIPQMLERYKDIVPIFHNRSEAGTKVST